MKGYKAFNKGLVCKDKQYTENTAFEEERAVIRERGMHFCENPFEVLNCYPLVNSDGEFSDFAEVESLAEAKTNDNKKYCTTKLKIGAKLSFAGFVKACIDFCLEKTIKDMPDCEGSSGDYAQIGSSGYAAKIGSSGDYAQIGSSGDVARIGSSGDYAKIGSSGDVAQIGSSGYAAKIGSSGDVAQIGSSGDYAKIGSSGDVAKIGSSGDYAKIGSSGDVAQIGSSGYAAKIGSSGDYARIGSSGDYAKIGSSGDVARIGSSGDYAQIGSSGDVARIGSSGEDSVICCAGDGSIVKAKKGSWITLSEWKYSEEKERCVPVCVKTEFVDGERIKEDTFYKLENGEFKEVGGTE